MKRIVSVCLLLVVAYAGRALAATDGLDELNTQRAQHGLRPFQRDNLLTQAALKIADVRAQLRCLHTQNDFAYLPAGAMASGSGTGIGGAGSWNSCYWNSDYPYAGAAWATDVGGSRYMHVFVSTVAAQPAIPPIPSSSVVTVAIETKAGELSPSVVAQVLPQSNNQRVRHGLFGRRR